MREAYDQAVEGWSKAMEQMVAGEEFASASGRFLKRYVEMQESLRAASRAAAGERRLPHHRRHRAPRPARDQRRAQGRRGRGRGPRDRRAPGSGRGHARQPRAKRPPARRRQALPRRVAPWRRHRRTARARVPEPPTRYGSRRWCAGWESSRRRARRDRDDPEGRRLDPEQDRPVPLPAVAPRAHATPVLLVYALINKPYILDLGPATASSATCCARATTSSCSTGARRGGRTGAPRSTSWWASTCRRPWSACGRRGPATATPSSATAWAAPSAPCTRRCDRGPEEPRRAHGARGLLRGRHLLVWTHRRHLDAEEVARALGNVPGPDRPRQQDAEAGAEPRQGIRDMWERLLAGRTRRPGSR